MHRMIAGEGESGHNRDTGILRRNRARRQRIFCDAIVDLGVDGILVNPDSRAARAAGFDRFAEPLLHVSHALAGGVLKRDEKSSVVWLVVAVIAAPPRIYVHHAI